MLLILATTALILWPTIQSRSKKESKSQTSITSIVGKALVNAAATFSPKLAQWIGGEKITTVPFYEKFEQILNRHLGLNRGPEQTQSEFAQSASNRISSKISDTQQLQPINQILSNVTDAFYQARFSSIPLDKLALNDIENQIQSLEQILKTTKS